MIQKTPRVTSVRFYPRRNAGALSFESFLASTRPRPVVPNAYADELAGELGQHLRTVNRWIEGETDYAAMRRAMVFFNRKFPGEYEATPGRMVYRGQCSARFDGSPRSYTYDKTVAEAFPPKSFFGSNSGCLFVSRRACKGSCADASAFRLSLDLGKLLSKYHSHRFAAEKEVVILNTRPAGAAAAVAVRENAPRKPVDRITDRAKRYRANADGVRPGPPKQCGFCGKRKTSEVHHVDGNESDSSKENLMWACRACNVRVGNRLRKAKIGRVTNQFNPGKMSRRLQMLEYGNAIKVMRGDFDGDVGAAVATIRATPSDVRSAYTSRTWPTRRALYGPSGRQSEIPF